VQQLGKETHHSSDDSFMRFYVLGRRVEWFLLCRNDGFERGDEFFNWFATYPDGDMAILHFTDFRY